MSANDQSSSSSNKSQESSSTSQDKPENNRSDSIPPSTEDSQSSTSNPTTTTDTSESIFSLLSKIPSSLFAIVKRRLSEEIEQAKKTNHEQRERYYARMQERLHSHRPTPRVQKKKPQVSQHTQPTPPNRVQKNEPQVSHHTPPIQRKLSARQYARKINKEKAKAIQLANSTSQGTQTDKPDKGKGRAMFDPTLPTIDEEAEPSQEQIILPYLVGDEDADYQRAIIESIKSEEERINRDRLQNSALPTSYLFDVNNYSSMPFTTTKTLPWNQPLKFNEASTSCQRASSSKLPAVSHGLYNNQASTSTQNLFEPSSFSQDSSSGNSFNNSAQHVFSDEPSTSTQIIFSVEPTTSSYSALYNASSTSTQNFFEPSTSSQSASTSNLPILSHDVIYDNPTQFVLSNEPSIQSILSSQPSTSSHTAFYDAPSTPTQGIFNNDSFITQEEFVYGSSLSPLSNSGLFTSSQTESGHVYTDNDSGQLTTSPQPATVEKSRTPSQSPTPVPPVNKKPAKRTRARSVSNEPTRSSKRLKEKQERKELASTKIPRPVQKKRGGPPKR